MPARVRVTAKFEANLDSIRDFLLAERAAPEFGRLLKQLSHEGEAALRPPRRNAGRDTALRGHWT